MKESESNGISLVVLAAGLASRYGSLKQIDQFGPSGETIIDYSIYDAIRAGFEKVVFVIRRNIEEEFKEVFVGKFGSRISVDYVFQELDLVPEGVQVPEIRKKPWGTGHAVLMAAPKISGPFAVINADDFYGHFSFQLLHRQLAGMQKDQLQACLIGYRLRNTLSDHGYVSRGICSVSAQAHLQNVTERTKIFKNGKEIYFEEGDEKGILSGEEIVSMNLVGFTPAFFDVLQAGFKQFAKRRINEPKAEYFLPDAVSQIVTDYQATVQVVETTDATFGVTYQQDKPIVQRMIEEQVARGVYPSKLWKS